MSPTGTTGLPKLGNVLYQTVVEFPYSAYTVQRIPDQPARDAPTVETPSDTTASTSEAMPHKQKNAAHERAQFISDSLATSCQSDDSVSALLKQDPKLSPGEAWKLLEKSSKNRDRNGHEVRESNKDKLEAAELDLAFRCGKWGKKRPSDLFLKLYHDALCTLNKNHGDGMASPSLLGSSGTVRLTVLSVIPDIVRHMSNLIVRAEKEVFLATNFWQSSVASTFITDAIREASRRHGERGTRLTVKVLYDRGSLKQLFEPHYIVQEREYTGKAVRLPAKDEIPHIDMEVMNYHDALLGTFHSKFMIVDRKIGIIQSNNIQDNDNLEMMLHVEGPIVDGLYDMALLSWHKRLDPALPMISAGPCHAAPTALEGTSEGHGDAVSTAGALHLPKRAAAFGIGADTIIEPAQETSSVSGQITVPANPVVGAQPTSLAANDTKRLPEHTHEDPHYDVDIAGEVARVQAAVSAKPGETQMEAVTRHLNHTTNKGFKGTAPDCDDVDDAMTPYILHPAQEPFPIALVNRAPYGPPNHHSVLNPQNAAWLSALRHAQKNVFIQSPTLNAEPLIPAMIDACERGIDVYAYICLGYNDSGELLPMQGGHNEMIAAHLYEQLSPQARERLHYYWYTAKDQIEPITAEKKKRSCHVKLMIVDESIAIVGSGNQDTQSWYHSQEVNILLESESVCAAWIDGLRRNQNTHRYGALGKTDGIWRDAEGKEADGAMGVDPGRLSWLKGFTGAIKRVQGTGGF